MEMIIYRWKCIQEIVIFAWFLTHTTWVYKASVEATKIRQEEKEITSMRLYRKTQHICCRSKSSTYIVYSTWMLRDNGTGFSVVVNERIVIHLGAKEMIIKFWFYEVINIDRKIYYDFMPSASITNWLCSLCRVCTFFRVNIDEKKSGAKMWMKSILFLMSLRHRNSCCCAHWAQVPVI